MNEVLSTWKAILTTVPHGDTYVMCWFGGALVWLLGSLLLARKEGLPLGRCAFIFFASVVLACVGARAHALLFEANYTLSEIVSSPGILLEPGWRLPGGLLLVLIVVPPLAWVLRVPFLLLADSMTPLVGVAFAIGRLGCLSRGCCHGFVSDLPWALRFGPDTEAYANHLGRGLIPPGAELSLPVHPLPIYLAIGGLVMSAVLLWMRRHRRFPGEIALVAVALLGWIRVEGELFRETELVPPVRLRQALPLITGSLATIGWVALVARKKWKSAISRVPSKELVLTRSAR